MQQDTPPEIATTLYNRPPGLERAKGGGLAGILTPKRVQKNSLLKAFGPCFAYFVCIT